MGLGKDSVRLLCLVLLHLSVAATFLIQCDARNSRQFKASSPGLQTLKNPRSSEHRVSKKLKSVKHMDTYTSSDPYYTGTPLSMPLYQDVLGASSPSSSPQPYPPNCVYPPLTPQLPSNTPPTPISTQTPPAPMLNPPIITPNPPESLPSTPSNGPMPNPPIYIPSPPNYEPSPPGNVPNPPITMPSPQGNEPIPPIFMPSPPGNEPVPPITGPSPPGNEPNPPITVPSPPSSVPSPLGIMPSPVGIMPSPPGIIPSPPENVPGPPVFIPGPIVFLPPIVYPPPSARSPPVTGTTILWCVAKPTVPDPIIQEAMNYACGSGADCDSIQPSGSCYKPDTLIAHASFAFNSYWQRTRAAGGTCDFGGTAMLVTRDPSFDGCHFITSELQ